DRDAGAALAHAVETHATMAAGRIDAGREAQQSGDVAPAQRQLANLLRAKRLHLLGRGGLDQGRDALYRHGLGDGPELQVEGLPRNLARPKLNPPADLCLEALKLDPDRVRT